MIRALIEITVSDIEKILEWYHVYKIDPRYYRKGQSHKDKPTSEDADVATKLTAMLITAKQEESERYHPISFKYPKRGN